MMLNTSNPNNYEYATKYLEIHILGGLKTNKLESLRVTISIQKPKEHNILRHSIDLYNDNQVEKFTRKIAERLEIGTSVARRTLQELTRELENYRFLLIEQYEQQHQPYFKELTGTEQKASYHIFKETQSTKTHQRPYWKVWSNRRRTQQANNVYNLHILQNK